MKRYFFYLSTLVILNFIVIHLVLITIRIESDYIKPEIIKVIPIYTEEETIDIEEEVLGVDYQEDFIPGFYQYESPTDERIPLSDDEQRNIQDICERYDIDVNLIYAICESESGYSATATNNTCKGIMQMNTTYHKMDDPFDIYQNIEAGCKYLRTLLDDYDNNLEVVMGVYHGEKDALTKTTPSYYTRKIIERRNQLAEPR